MALQFPRINGFCYDFSSMEFNFSGTVLSALESVDYSESVEEGERRGSAAEVFARTRGQLQKGEGTVVGDKEEVQAFLDKLGDGRLEKTGTATFVYGNDGAATTTDVLHSVRILGVADSHSQGTDALNMELTISFLYMTRNGKTALINQRR
jgi:hypothetical protein